MFGVDGIFYALGAAIIVALAAFFKGRLDGARLERANQLRKEAKARDIHNEVQNDIGALTPEQRREALKKW